MHIPLRLIWKLLLINMTSLLMMLLLVAVAVHWLAKSNLQVERFDLAELTKQTLRSFELRFVDKQLQVTQSLPIAMIHSDRERLTQVLTNLFENALRYSPTGGSVALSLSRIEQRVRFFIVNDIEESQQLASSTLESQSLFERFQRGDTSRSREFGGAGLGLAIVKERIVAHRGYVGYRFEDGKAEFSFELPV